MKSNERKNNHKHYITPLQLVLFKRKFIIYLWESPAGLKTPFSTLLVHGEPGAIAICRVSSEALVNRTCFFFFSEKSTIFRGIFSEWWRAEFESRRVCLFVLGEMRVSAAGCAVRCGVVGGVAKWWHIVKGWRAEWNQLIQMTCNSSLPRSNCGRD